MTDPNTAELKPCPFCGEVPTHRTSSGLTECTNADCPIEIKAFSVEDWNTRTAAPQHTGLTDVERVAMPLAMLTRQQMRWLAKHPEARAALLVSNRSGVGGCRDALSAIHACRLRDGKDEGYGWNITALNKAMNAALPLLGLPQPPDPFPNGKPKPLRTALDIPTINEGER